jgi:hypothetical protein
VKARPTLLKGLGERLGRHSADELARIFERVGLPFAPIRRPEDLYDDPHLAATGGLADIRLPDGERAGQTVKTTLFPIALEGQRLGVRLDPPKMGEHTRELLPTRATPGRDRSAAFAIGRRVTRTAFFRRNRMSHSPSPPSRRRALRQLAGAALAGALLGPRLARAQLGEKADPFVLPNATASGVDTITRAARRR